MPRERKISSITNKGKHGEVIINTYKIDDLFFNTRRPKGRIIENGTPDGESYIPEPKLQGILQKIKRTNNESEVNLIVSFSFDNTYEYLYLEDPNYKTENMREYYISINAHKYINGIYFLSFECGVYGGACVIDAFTYGKIRVYITELFDPNKEWNPNNFIDLLSNIDNEELKNIVNRWNTYILRKTIQLIN